MTRYNSAVEAVENKTLVIPVQWVRERTKVEHPPPSLRFLETRSVNELTVGDVAAMLEEYRWLSRALRPPPQPGAAAPGR